jgi:3(or 17)beta-hydroxysteroid dehydrogenase
MGRVSGKTAIVTGASLGLGRAAALLLAREGARVVLTDVREAEGAKTCADIVAAGGEAIFLRHDVASEDDWIGVIKATTARFGGVDVVVNNAGVLFSAKIEETPL